MEMCPFCPLMGIEPKDYQPVQRDFFGGPAMIGNVHACDACATVASVTGTVQELLEELRVSQKG